MSDGFEALESELCALKPAEISPELRRRIVGQLGAVERQASFGSAGGRRWRLAVVGGGLVAASICFIVLRGLDYRPRPSVVVVPNSESSSESDSSTKTLLSYERALARSTSAFEALLDTDARSAEPTNVDGTGVGVLSFTSPRIKALIGEE